MTELQGALGKVQLKKLNSIIAKSKLRYNALRRSMGNQFVLRKIPKGSEIIYDTLIFYENDKKLRDIIVQHLKKEGFGTKNLPDAIQWHCSVFWDHALPQAQIKRTQKTKKILSKAIAIPIWLKKSVKDYIKLGSFLKSIR